MRNNSYGEFDSLFSTKLDSWVLFRKNFFDAFGTAHTEALNRAERTFKAADRTTVFLSFENRLASLGGLAAVMRLLPHHLRKKAENVLFFTPCHCNHPKVKYALDKGVLRRVAGPMKLHLCSYKGEVSLYQDTEAEIPSYFVAVKGRFTAAPNIYLYSQPEELLEDSLVFCAAVPYLLQHIGYRRNLLFHAHDWETAPVAITSKLAVVDGLLESTRTVLTLHNSFDSGISRKKKQQFFGRDFPGNTILQCTIPLLNGPLTSVSTPFAYELRSDPLQREIFTNHLQEIFTMNPPVGVENGLFGQTYSPFTYAAVSRARRDDFSLVLQQKQRFREKMMQVIGSVIDENVIGSLGNIDSSVPVLFMSGRMDLMQKGFDVIFQAFRRLPRGSAKLLFCPSSGSTPAELEFFSHIESQCRGDISIWPFRISSEQYNSILSGASFLLMPSFYEPFGAATEGFMHATPVIARGTGGLWVQVQPYDGIHIPDFYNSLFHFSGALESATGVLFREVASETDAQKGWRECLSVPVKRRMESPFYRSMVDAAFDALVVAQKIFGDEAAYGRMAFNGTECLRDFSWDVAVEKYRKVYDVASFRGYF